jgi:non-specific serine/threonine protein kinase
MGSKMAKILHYLVEKIKNTSGNILLFCIWDSICKKIIEELANNGIKSLFLQGTTSTKERTLQLFNNPRSEYRLMSLSTKWSAEGTNLTRADMVVFVDPIHGSKEDRRNKMLQAISRSHRIGQKNDVEVVMFVMEDTVESETIQDETFEFINDLNTSEKKIEK